MKELARPAFYLIPGLGADERVFQFLQLQGRVQVVKWLEPLSKTEPLTQYAARLATTIPPGPCWLVGVSFGGVLAQEVAHWLPEARVVLISSFTDARQLPPVLGLARRTGLYHLLPPQLLKLVPRVAQWLFGARNGNEYRLLRQIISDTDAGFARWAIAQLLQWEGAGSPAIRIHGTRDRLLPAGKAQVDFLIADGGHFMIVSHASEISRILNQLAEAG